MLGLKLQVRSLLQVQHTQLVGSTHKCLTSLIFFNKNNWRPIKVLYKLFVNFCGGQGVPISVVSVENLNINYLITKYFQLSSVIIKNFFDNVSMYVLFLFFWCYTSLYFFLNISSSHSYIIFFSLNNEIYLRIPKFNEILLILDCFFYT